MKKKLTGFLMCFVMLCMTLFAGCSLIETDGDRYYNAVISEIRNKDGVKVAEVTNKELISGYQNYGQAYVQYYGMTQKEAVEETLRLLENRKLVVYTAEQMFTLSALEKTYLWEATASSLEENLQSYYDEIVDAEEETSTTNNDVTFEGYEKNATLEIVDGKYVIKKIDKHDGLLENYTPSVSSKDATKEEDKQLMYQNFLDGLYTEDYQKAFNQYLKSLKMAEQGQKLSTDTYSIFMREIDRLYKINYENLMVEKYTQSHKGDATQTDVTAKNILDLYASRVRASYTKYVFENDSDYDSDVQDSINDVYYIRTDADANKYFTVANILFQFTDEQQAKYSSYTTKYKNQDGNSYSYTQYQLDINALYAQIQPVVRQYNSVTGVYEEVDCENITVDEIIYDKIQIALLSAQATENVNFIGETINDYIYQYNQDPGMLNADANYVIGVDENGKAVSDFVESFDDAGLSLYNNGNGKFGDMTVARSEFGIHVLVYTGECQNLFDNVGYDFELSDSVESGAIEKLYTTRINPLVDKTYFDALYDEIYEDKYSYFETQNLNLLKQDYTITVYSGRIPSALLEG